MHRVLVVGNFTDYDWCSYKVRMTETGRQITCNKRDIWRAPIMTEHYLREWTVKGIRCLKYILSETKSIMYNRVFNPHTAHTQVDTYHNDKQED